MPNSTDDRDREGLREARNLLHRALTPHGFLASPTDRTNYRRVWSRDGVICGLAGLASGDDDLANGLRATLETLAAAQGPQGQIPSNVSIDANGTPGAVSYGGLAGRVDAIPWFVLGVARWVEARDDDAFLDRIAPVVERALDLLNAWEFNARGLVYVPQSGDWADEYDLHGYLLYDQVLRLAALSAWAPHTARPLDLDRLEALIATTFWPRPDADPAFVYHPHALHRLLSREGEPEHPLAALTPGGYVARFDGLGSALALAFGIAFTGPLAERLLDCGERLAAQTAAGLLPAFWPPVTEEDPAWAKLAENYRDHFSNRPGHYHNGGVWPMVSGWWGVALARHGRTDAARAVLDRLHTFNRLDAEGEEWGFYEYAPADAVAPYGTRHQAWSAAAVLLLHHALADATTPDGRPSDGKHDAPSRTGTSDDAAHEVIVAGELLVDLIADETTDGLEGAARFERHAGGSAANLAGNLARVGRRVVLAAAVGRDGFGRFLREHATRSGLALRLAERPEPTTHVFVARSTATPDFVHVRGADRLLRPDQLPDTALAAATLFHTTGFALSLDPARSVILDAAHRADAAGTAVSLDVNFAPATDAQRRADCDATEAVCRHGALIKCSADDLARLFPDLAPLDAVARLHAWGAALVAFTRGADGVRVSWDGGDESAEVAAVPVDVQDATGAGDAFWAGFLAAWLENHPPPRCAEAGARLAALKLARVGPLPDRIDPTVLYSDP